MNLNIYVYTIKLIWELLSTLPTCCGNYCPQCQNGMGTFVHSVKLVWELLSTLSKMAWELLSMGTIVRFPPQVTDRLGMVKGAEATEGSWVLDKKPAWLRSVTDPSESLKRILPSSTDKAWISLLRFADAKTRRKTVFQVTTWRVSSTHGSKGALVKDQGTNERSHWA